MLPKAQRLTRDEVAEVVAIGRRAGTRELGMRVAAHSGPTCLAIVVSSKELKLAVDRHRLKRRIRAAIHGLSPLVAGYHLVIFATRAASDWTYQELNTRLKQLFHDL
jgi:ribonuclease P protein component